MKSAAWIVMDWMIGSIVVPIVILAVIATRAHAQDGKDAQWAQCMKRIQDKKRCDLMLEIRQNLADAEKKRRGDAAK